LTYRKAQQEAILPYLFPLAKSHNETRNMVCKHYSPRLNVADTLLLDSLRKVLAIRLGVSSTRRQQQLNLIDDSRSDKSGLDRERQRDHLASTA
jgi:hypothetical protein